MSQSDYRSEHRRKVVFNAKATRPDGSRAIRCAVLDASPHGCRLVCRHVRDLPDAIKLHLDGFEPVLDGRIAWRTDKMAGVVFEWPEDARRRREIEDWFDVGAVPVFDLAPERMVD